MCTFNLDWSRTAFSSQCLALECGLLHVNIRSVQTWRSLVTDTGAHGRNLRLIDRHIRCVITFGGFLVCQAQPLRMAQT